jgi:hypothetical protein
MKTFVKENWYKLMIGSSMFIFSVSALIYSVSPARAENVFKAKSNSAEAGLDYLVDSQNNVWHHSPKDHYNKWYSSGFNLHK